MQQNKRITPLSKQRLTAAARLCARAFHKTPHIVYFFPDAASREAQTSYLFEMRLRYGLLYGEVHVPSLSVEGIAVWIPSNRATMTIWRQIRSGGVRLYRHVGRDAVARMTHVAEHNDALRERCTPAEHWFLSILAVDPPNQEKGYAGQLLQSMHERLDNQGSISYAETTEEHLLPFYERFGYKVAESSIVPGTDLPVWALIRQPKH